MTEIQKIKINDDDEAWEYLSKALDGTYDNDIIDLNFDNWPIFHINVKGERYDSTLPTSLMKALVEFQGHLNRVYAEIIYNKSARSLTIEERKALEIAFRVEQGSSDIVADLSGFFTELAKGAVDKMTGDQILITVIGTAAILGAVTAYKYYMDDRQETKKEDNRHAITAALIESQPKLMSLANEQIASYTAILKSVPDATKVTLDHTEFSKEQIQEITHTERQASEIARLDDLYIISSLKNRFDKYKVEITRVSDNRLINADLFKDRLSLDEMTKITTSLTTEKSINLNIVARVRADAINSASIIGVNNKANGARLVADLSNQEVESE